MQQAKPVKSKHQNLQGQGRRLLQLVVVQPWSYQLINCSRQPLRVTVRTDRVNPSDQNRTEVPALGVPFQGSQQSPLFWPMQRSFMNCQRCLAMPCEPLL